MRLLPRQPNVLELLDQKRMHVLTRQDAARLLRWSMLWGNSHPEDGPEVRQLVILMKDMLAPEDMLMLAQIAQNGGYEWLSEMLIMSASGGHHG